jgi:predicted  nucleic acid-binding Zn-ribbon protein
MAEGNTQYAVDIAKDLSRRLVASQARVTELEGRLAELEVEAQVYRDRSEQAEQWLNKISSELQGRVAESHGEKRSHSSVCRRRYRAPELPNILIAPLLSSLVGPVRLV